MNGLLDNETLTNIQDTAVKAGGAKGKVEIVHPPAEPDEVYLVVAQDGNFNRVVADPKPRKHVLSSIDQVGPFVKHLGESKPVVWYDVEGVVVICDDGTRRDQATLFLHKTPQLKVLERLEDESPKFDQKKFIRLLRIELAGCFEDRRLLAAIRECNFKSGSEIDGRFQHGKESLGRDIETAAVSTSTEQIPEEQTLTVRIFDDPFLTDQWDIECAVEIHPQEAKFELMPLPLAITNAIALELTAVQRFLVESCPKDTPIFRGIP